MPKEQRKKETMNKDVKRHISKRKVKKNIEKTKELERQCREREGKIALFVDENRILRDQIETLKLQLSHSISTIMTLRNVIERVYHPLSPQRVIVQQNPESQMLPNRMPERDSTLPIKSHSTNPIESMYM